MTTIGSTTSTTFDPTLNNVGVSSVQQNTPTQTGSTETPETPFATSYLGLPFQRATLDSLGLSQPRNLTDAGVLLAQVALALDEIFSQNMSETLKSQAETRRSAFAAIIALNEGLTALGVRNEQLNAQIDQWTNERTQKSAERDGAVYQRDQKQQEANAYYGQMITYAGQVNTYQSLANSATKDSDRQTYLNLRDIAQNNYNTAFNNYNSANNQITSLNNQINTLNGQIQTLTNQIDGAKAEVTDNETRIAAYTAQLTALLSALALIQANNNNSGIVPDSGLSVPLAELEDALADFDVRFQDLRGAEGVSKLRDSDLDAIKRVADKALTVINAITDVLQAILGLDLPPVIDPQTGNNENGRMRLPV